MKTIKLNYGHKALIDDVDAEIISRFKWHCHFSEGRKYAMTDLGTFGKRTPLYMHRLLMKTGRGETIDHINGNGLDNRRSNLRIASIQQNLWNCGPNSKNRSGYKGVSWYSRANKWRSHFRQGRLSIYLGLFDSKEAAARAYDREVVKHRGGFAFLNFPIRKEK